NDAWLIAAREDVMSGRNSGFAPMRSTSAEYAASEARKRIFPSLLAAAAALFLGTITAWAQSPQQPVTNSARANSGTIGIISGGADGTYIRIAADLANVLDGENLRILPMIGRGSLQNLRDIMFLRGVDIGIVQMDA